MVLGINISSIENMFIKLLDGVNKLGDVYETRSRAGIFSPGLVLWVNLFSRIKGDKSLSRALDIITNGESDSVLKKNSRHRLHTIDNMSLSTGGLSRAQTRFSEGKLNQIVEAINDNIIKESNSRGKCEEKKVYVFDGSTIILSPTEQNKELYKSVRNNKGECYSPHLLCMFCNELSTGIAMYPKYGPYRGEQMTCESELFYQIIDDLPKNSVVMGDRAYGIFPIAYVATQKKHDVLLRLSITQAKGVGGGKKHLEKYENIEEEVEWKFRTTRATHLKIPEGASVKGRFIKYSVKREGIKTLELYFFTTLKEPLSEILDLYLQREKIENDIRTMKHVLGLERFFSKSPKMINFELKLGFLAYNLVRIIMQKAAIELKIQPREVSFKRAVSLINIYGNKIRDTNNKSNIQQYRSRFLKGIYQTRLPKRKNRLEPRKLATVKDTYPVMRNSRADEREKQKIIFKNYGHRGYFSNVSRDS